MTYDNLVERSALAVARAEKQVFDQSFQLREMHACEYGTKTQAESYEKLLEDQLELKKLQVRHQRITRSTGDGSF